MTDLTNNCDRTKQTQTWSLYGSYFVERIGTNGRDGRDGCWLGWLVNGCCLLVCVCVLGNLMRHCRLWPFRAASDESGVVESQLGVIGRHWASMGVV